MQNQPQHDHSMECKHLNLEYCPVCKVAYCKDCGKEWGEPVSQNTWVYPVTTPGTVSPWYTTGGGSTGGSVTVTVGDSGASGRTGGGAGGSYSSIATDTSHTHNCG